MHSFSERSFWTMPPIEWAATMLETDHSDVYNKDPFIVELIKSNSMNKDQLKEFKSQYWPSLITALHHENPYLRTLVISLMVGEKQGEVEKELWHHWEDPFPLCRLLMIKGFASQNRAKVFQELFLLITSDPLTGIRKLAAKRISKDFPDLLSYKFDNFEMNEQIHLLELLDSSVSADRQIMEEHFQSNDELSLWINFNLKSKGVLSEILLREDFKSFKKKLDNSHYLINGDLLDIATAKNQKAIRNIIPSYTSMDDSAVLENILLHSHELEDKEDEKDLTLQLFIEQLKKREGSVRISWIDSFFQNYRWNKENLNRLLQLVKVEKNQCDDLILRLLEDDDFLLTKEWVKELNHNLKQSFFNKLLFSIRTQEVSSPVFKNSFMLLLGGNTKQVDDTFLVLCNRINHDNSINILEVFQSTLEFNEKSFTEGINRIWKKECSNKALILSVLPDGFTPELSDDFFEAICFFDDQSRKKILENLLRLDRDNFFPIIIQFYSDSSYSIRKFVENVLEGELSSSEQALKEEWCS